MMKMIRVALLSAVFVVVMCGGVFAESSFIPQGSVVVPTMFTWYKDSYNKQFPYIHLTNITGETVSVKVTVLDQDGNDVSFHGRVLTGSNSEDFPEVASGSEFDIPPHSARLYSFYTHVGVPVSIVGSATVEWSTPDTKIRKALVGIVRELGWSGNANGWTKFGAIYQLNNGQPF